MGTRVEGAEFGHHALVDEPSKSAYDPNETTDPPYTQLLLQNIKSYNFRNLHIDPLALNKDRITSYMILYMGFYHLILVLNQMEIISIYCKTTKYLPHC